MFLLVPYENTKQIITDFYFIDWKHQIYSHPKNKKDNISLDFVSLFNWICTPPQDSWVVCCLGPAIPSTQRTGKMEDGYNGNKEQGYSVYVEGWAS